MIDKENLVAGFAKLFRPLLGGPETTSLAQERRVRGLIESDRADRRRERQRKEANVEVGDGRFVNIADTVMEPTPEWMAKHEFASYTPDKEHDTIRPISTVRKMSVGAAVRMHRKGRLSDDQLKACRWYQGLYEASGLEGRVKSANLSKEIHGTAVSGFTFTEAQLEAQDNFRLCRKNMRKRYIKLFDLVMLNDVPITRAARIAPSTRHPEANIRMLADEIGHVLAEVKANR